MIEKRANDERTVLVTILEALDHVPSEDRERILRTVLTYLDISVRNEPRRIASESRQIPNMPSHDRDMSFADRATQSPKDFLHEKQPQTDIERVACLAYYLSHFLNTPHFKTIDISKLNTDAAQLKFSNPAQTVVNATNSDLLTSAGKGKKQISAIGERFVDALPDREVAKSLLHSSRPRRARKAGSNTKQIRKTST